MPICEMVRNARLRTRSNVMASAAIRKMILVRNTLASQLSETMSWNARSVVLSSSCATGMRSCA